MPIEEALYIFLVCMIVQKGDWKKAGPFWEATLLAFAENVGLFVCSALGLRHCRERHRFQLLGGTCHQSVLVSNFFQFVIARCLVPLMQLADSILYLESAYKAPHLNIRCYWLVILLSPIATFVQLIDWFHFPQGIIPASIFMFCFRCTLCESSCNLIWTVSLVQPPQCP